MKKICQDFQFLRTSIRLKFIPSKVQSKAGVICIQLIHKRKTKLLRTRFYLFAAEWDSKTETVRIEHAGSERQKYLQSVQSSLSHELKQINELIRVLAPKSDYTIEELAGLYISHSFNGYLSPFIDHIIKDLKAGNRTKTADICMTVKKSFERFRCGHDILIDRIDNELITKYENFLKDSGIMNNTISCYMRSFRSIYNQAVERGLATQKSPFSGINTSNDKTTKRAVSEDVIIRLKNMDLSSCQELCLSRDMFMFSFYMRGISFVDMANLKTGNLKNGYITYSRSKTRQKLTVKIEPCMQTIISQYNLQTVDDYLLPIYTPQNRNHVSQLRNHNKRLHRISELLGLEKSLSSYVSRHSWATLAFRKGVPIEVISKGMGHENETTTRIYLASLDQSIVDQANAEIINLK